MEEIEKHEFSITNDYVISPQFSKQYNELLRQYDMLISDGSYKGVNLLLNQNLSVQFNEKNSSKIEVKGTDATSRGIGLEEVDWIFPKNTEQTISNIDAAIKKLRTISEGLSSYYGIISNRENFTENLIVVLEDGADELTLADMNEESANILALQTRQKLNINALSLASQAAQSVLKLFQS
ncbi:MAG: flagellin [Alphaproteobacteria bacterium]